MVDLGHQFDDLESTRGLRGGSVKVPPGSNEGSAPPHPEWAIVSSGGPGIRRSERQAAVPADLPLLPWTHWQLRSESILLLLPPCSSVIHT